MKPIPYLCTAAIVLVVGAVLFQILDRLANEAIITFVGVGCGIIASIPVSFGLLIMLNRGRNVGYAVVEVDVSPPAQRWDRVSLPPLTPSDIKQIEATLSGSRQ